MDWKMTALSIVLFLGIVPTSSFYIGMQYQKLIDMNARAQDQHIQNLPVNAMPVSTQVPTTQTSVTVTPAAAPAPIRSAVPQTPHPQSAPTIAVPPAEMKPATPELVQPTAAPPKPLAPPFAAYPSPEGTYTLTAFKMINSDTCGYEVNDKKGHAFDPTTLLGHVTYTCTSSDQGLANDFQKWLDDTTFLMSAGGKTFKIDVVNKTATPQ